MSTPTLAVSNAGSGPLVLATVTPLALSGQGARMTRIQCLNGSTLTVDTGNRLGTVRLIAPGSTSSRNYRAAAKDVNGVWSEWSANVALTAANYSAGATAGSIGSGKTTDRALTDPAYLWPLLANGTSKLGGNRTLTPQQPAFEDETRAPKWPRQRFQSNISLDIMDSDQRRMLHRFFRAVHGSVVPHWFDWTDPDTNVTRRLLVRFAGPQFATSMFDVNYAETSLSIAELLDGYAAGGASSYDEKFVTESVGQPVEDSTRWDGTVGTPSDIGFELNGNNIAIVNESSSQSGVNYLPGPVGLHQRAEADIVTGPGAAETAVYVRYVDASNYIWLNFVHSTGVVTLYERISGTNNTLLTATLSPVPTTLGLRVEAVGTRVRIWYEPGEPVRDRPPDAAANLTGTYSAATVYKWGVILKATGHYVSRFNAADLPPVALPPPQLTVAAASGLLFTPITAAASGVSGSAVQLEWEVYSADPDDWPEGHRGLAASSITSRVLWVRPGYAYDVRVREVGPGYYGAWTAAQRITASGSKVGPTAPTLPNDAFPAVTPSYTYTQQQDAMISADVKDSGWDTSIALGTMPRPSFKAVFANKTNADYQLLVDFFEAMRGQNAPFQWTDPDSAEVFAARFASDDYELKYAERGQTSSIASIELAMEEVVLGVAGTLTFDLTADTTI